MAQAPRRTPAGAKDFNYDLPELNVAAPTGAEAAPDKPSTFVQGLKRGGGGVLANMAATGQDLGLPLEGVRKYGERLEAENPADINEPGDIVRHPLQFGKETAAELAPQVGLSFGAERVGNVVGGFLGAEGGPPGIAAGAYAGGKVAQFLTNLGQEYGTVRRGQAETGVDDKGRALLTGAGAAALDVFGPVDLITGRIARKGIKDVTKKTVGSYVKTGALAGFGEGITEPGQSYLERVGAGQPTDPSDPGARQDYILSSAKGALGGTALGLAEHGLSKHEQAQAQVSPPNDDDEKDLLALPAPVRGKPLALPAPEKQLALPAPSMENRPPVPDVVAGEAPAIAGRVTDQRPPAPMAWRNAIGRIESSNDYTRRGPEIKTGMYAGERAAGYYGIMPGNIPAWSRAALGREVSLQEFLASPQIQDAIFDHRFGAYVRQFGNARDAASAWLTGKPLNRAGGRTDPLGTNAQKYVAMFEKYGGEGGVGAGPTEGGEQADAGPEIEFDDPMAILRRIEDIAGEDNAPDVQERLAKSIAKGGDEAARAIGFERTELEKARDSLVNRADTMTADTADRQLAGLARREKALDAALQVAERIAKAKTPELVTEPKPLDASTLPGGPQANPDLAQLGEQLAQEGADSYSARTQMEAGNPQLGYEQEAQAKQVATERADTLKQVMGDRDSLTPREDFLDTLQAMGLSTQLNEVEERTLRREENIRQRFSARKQAIEAQKQQAEQAAEPAPIEPAAAEPTEAAKPAKPTAPTPAPVAAAPAAPPAAVAEDIKDRAKDIVGAQGKPVVSKWYMEGVKAGLGEDYNDKVPTKQAKNFEAGKKYAEGRMGTATPPARPTTPRKEKRQAAKAQRQEAKAARRAAKLTPKAQAAVAARPAPKPTPAAAPAPKETVAEKPAAKTPTPTTQAAIEAKPPPKRKVLSATEVAERLKARKTPAPAAAAPAPKAGITPEESARRALFLQTVTKARSMGQITPLQATTLANAVTAVDNVTALPVIPTEALADMLDEAKYQNAEGNSVKASAVTRRGFGALMAGGVTATAAQAAPRTTVEGNASVTAALQKGDVHGVVRAIMATTKNPHYRELARMMTLGGFAKDATIEVWDMGDADLNLLGVTDIKTGNIKVFKTTHKDGSGLSEETILHEALHSWLAARYGDIEASSLLARIMTNPQNRKAFEKELKAKQKLQGEEFVRKFDALHQKFAKMVEEKFPEMTVGDADDDATNWDMYFAYKEADEFFVRMFTAPKLQDWLRTHDLNGNVVKPANPNSFWSKLMAMIRDLFGIKAPSPSLLNAAMDAGWSVIKAGTLDSPTKADNQKGSADFEGYGRLDGGRQMFTSGKPETATVREQTTEGKSRALGTGLRGMQTGVLAKDANLSTLGEAIEALKTMSPEAVAEKYGWRYDADDGQWKVEISDEDAKLTKEWGAMQRQRLGDVLHHPALFRAYPQLANMPVTFKQDDETNGFFDGSRINISPDADQLKTLIHEIQHAIQEVEGFATGGSYSQFKFDDPAQVAKVRNYLERRQREDAERVADDLAEGGKGYPDRTIKSRMAALEDLEEDMPEMARLRDEIADADRRGVDLQNQIDALNRQEGFKQRQRDFDTAFAALDYKRDLIRQRIKDLPPDASRETRRKLEEARQQLLEQRAALKRPTMDTADFEKADALAAKQVELSENQRIAQDRLAELIEDHQDVARGMYLLLAGEVEARDTAARMRLTPDQRRAMPTGTYGIRSNEKIVTFDKAGAGDVRASAVGHGMGVTKKSAAVRKTPEAYARRSAVNKARTRVAISGEELVKQGHLWLTGTEDIANIMRSKGMDAGRRVVELHSNSHALGREFDERALGIKDNYADLPAKERGTGKGSLNELSYDMTQSGKWAFKPTWLEGDDAKFAVVDPKLADRFKAMSPKAQQVIKDQFQFNHDARKQLFTATVKTIKDEYDPLLAVATTQAQRESITADKERAMGYASRAFDTAPGLPYTPLKRSGAWVVTGKSKAFRAAIAAKDKKAIDKMVNDENHNFVDFRETVGEAEALASHIETKFPGGADFFARNKAANHITGPEIFFAFGKLKDAVAGDTELGAKASLRLNRLVTDLYLHALSETSARKGELGRAGLGPGGVSARDPVTGEVLDMMKAFIDRAHATSNLIASIENGPALNRAINDLQKQADAKPIGQRREAQRLVNEMMYRYTANLGVQPSRVVDRVVRTVSIWTLLSSPFYYFQNATQHALITIPIMASKWGYGASWAATQQAYADFGYMTKGTSLTARVDYSKAEDPKIAALLQFLAKRGRLDAGYSADLGHWEVDGEGALPQAWNKADKFLRMMPQRIEVMNRVATGISTYRLAKAEALGKGMSEKAAEEAAYEAASKMIYDTHGDYSGFNSPRPFTALGSFGKVALQFRKFQLIMGSLIAKEFHRAFKGATPEERMAGFKALAFTSAHMAAIGGIIAQPGAALLGPIIGALANLIDDDDDKDWSNWQDELRKALGAGGEGDKRSWLGDFLYKGAPYALLSMDTSDRLGMGNIAALAPYTDLPEAATSKEKMFEVLGKIMLGPSGGMLSKAVDGWGYGVEQKDWTRMAETLMPGAIGNSMKSARLATQGLTSKQGAVLVKGEDLRGMDAVYTALGVRPRSLVNQGERRSAEYDASQYYEGQTTKLKQRYRRALKDRDAGEKAATIKEFNAIQAARLRDGFKRQPLGTLLKAQTELTKQERNVRGGVPTTKTNRGFVDAQLFADRP